MKNEYTILSNEPAPERMVKIVSFDKLIKLCDLSIENLENWFSEYRYDAEIPQGSVFNNNYINIELKHLNKTEYIKLLVEGKSFKEEQTAMKQDMIDGEVMIVGEMEWTGGKWNSFSIKLEEDEKFDFKKIKAIGHNGLVTDYKYDNHYFENNEDWELSNGYINLDIYFFLKNELHELNFDKVIKSLKKNNINSLDSEIILKHLKNVYIPNLNQKNIIKKNKEVELEDIKEALDFHPDDMEMAAKFLRIDFKIFKEKVYSNYALKSKWVPKVKKESEIFDLKNITEIKKICIECLKNVNYFTNWRDVFLEKGYNIDPYDRDKCIFTIRLEKFNFHIGLMYRAEDKVDFIVGDYAGWS